MNISDPRFKWVRPENTDVAATWKKFGFKPTTEAERKARQSREEKPSNVTPFTNQKRNGGRK